MTSTAGDDKHGERMTNGLLFLVGYTHFKQAFNGHMSANIDEKNHKFYLYVGG
jgi:hypothetical protein